MSNEELWPSIDVAGEMALRGFCLPNDKLDSLTAELSTSYEPEPELNTSPGAGASMPALEVEFTDPVSGWRSSVSPSSLLSWCNVDVSWCS